MSQEDRVYELVARWETLHDRGQTISPEELCDDCPELVSPVAERIAKLRAVKPALQTRESPTEQPPAVSSDDGVSLDAAGSSPKTLGRYQLRRLQGRGGFGEVWEGFDPQLKRKVAIKVRRSDRAVRSDVFEAEAEKVAQLNHPGIVNVYDFGYEGDRCYIVYQWIDGMDLARWLRKKTPTIEQACRIAASVGDALEYAHSKRLIHRDVKPANVLLDRRGRVLLTDFGIAATQAQLADERFSGIGSVPYMTPEQVRGRGVEITPTTDVYGLGVVLFELLAKQPPFLGDTYEQIAKQIEHADPPAIRTYNRKVPVALEQICLKALQKKPRDRYATARDMAEDLRAFVAAQTTAPSAASSNPQETSIEATPGFLDSISQTLHTAYRRIVTTVKMALLLALLAGFALAVGMLISQREGTGRSNDPSNNTPMANTDFSRDIQNAVRDSGNTVGTQGSVTSETALNSPGHGNTLGAAIASELAEAEANKQRVAAILKDTLLQLPNQVLTTTTTGPPSTAGNAGHGVTRVRVPVEVRADQAAYARELSRILPALGEVAVEHYETQVKLTKQSPVTREWRWPSEYRAMPFEERVRFNKPPADVSLTVDAETNLDNSSVFPPPIALVPYDWYSTQSRKESGPVCTMILKALTKVRELSNKRFEELAAVIVMTDLSEAGTAQFAVYAVRDPGASACPSFLHSAIEASLRISRNDGSTIESTSVTSRTNQKFGPDGLIVAWGNSQQSALRYVSVTPGIRSRWHNQYTDTHEICMSWRGHWYIDVPADAVKDIAKVDLAANWKPLPAGQ